MANKAFDEGQAVRLGYTRNQKTGLRELTRGFPTSIDADEATAQDFLAGRVYIDNPKANKKTYAGRWRVVTIGWNEQIQQFVEVLRFGWATSILTANLPNEECRLATATDQRSDSRVLTLAWHSIASDSVKDCMDELSVRRTAGGFTNPTIQTVAHAGVWSIDTITPQQSDDGSYTITVTVIKVAAITAISDLVALTGIRSYVRDINNPFGLEGGYKTTTPKAGRKPTEGITLTYRALSLASRAVLEALGDEALLDLLSTADKAKYKTVKAQVDEDAGNTLKLTVVYQYIPLRTATPESDARFVSLKRYSQSGKTVLERSWDRIDPAQIKSLMSAANVNQNVIASMVTGPYADGAIYPGDWQAKAAVAPMTDNDGVRIVQTLIQYGDADVDVFLGDDPDHGSYTKYLFDATETQVNTFLAAVTFPAVATRPAGWVDINPAWSTPEVGITKMVSITHNADDGSLNLHAFYKSAASLAHTDVTGIAIGDSKSSTTTRAYGWNVSVAALQVVRATYSAQEVNKKKDFKITRRGTHTFDFEAVVQEFSEIDDGGIIIEDTDEKTVTRRTGEYILAAKLVDGQVFGPLAAAPAGTEVQVDPKENDVGSFTVVKLTTVWHELTSTSSSTKGTAESSTTTKVKATATAATLTAAAVNQVSEIENVPRKDGLKDTAKTDTAKLPIDSGAVIVEQNALLTKTLQILLNQTSIPAAGANEKVTPTANGLGGWDIAKIKTALQAGQSVKTWESSSLVNHDPKQWQEKMPRYTWSTDSADKNKLLGWYVYLYTASRYQTVSMTTTRTFALTMPNATGATGASGSGNGAGTSYKNRVVQLDPEVWCEEKIVITTSAWSSFTVGAQLVGYLDYSGAI